MGSNNSNNLFEQNHRQVNKMEIQQQQQYQTVEEEIASLTATEASDSTTTSPTNSTSTDDNDTKRENQLYLWKQQKQECKKLQRQTKMLNASVRFASKRSLEIIQPIESTADLSFTDIHAVWGDENEEYERSRQLEQDIIDGSLQRRDSDNSFTTLGLKELIDEEHRQEALERREGAYQAVLWEQYYQWEDEEQQAQAAQEQEQQQPQQRGFLNAKVDELCQKTSLHTTTTIRSASSHSTGGMLSSDSGHSKLLSADSCHSKSTTSTGGWSNRSLASLNFNGEKDEALAHVYQNAASKRAQNVAQEEALRLSMSLRLDGEDDFDDGFYNSYCTNGEQQFACSFATGLGLGGRFDEDDDEDDDDDISEEDYNDISSNNCEVEDECPPIESIKTHN